MAEFDIIEIKDLVSFKEMRDDWESLYKSDPNSHINISWSWIYGLLSAASFKWIVLCVKHVESSSHIAFLPLKTLSNGGFENYLIHYISYAGRPISAYSGFLCSPRYENTAIQQLSFYIQAKLEWDIFRLDGIKDSRFKTFLNSFPNTDFTILINLGYTSLRISLPDDYEYYLSRYIRKETRRIIRRRTRFVLNNERFKITYSNSKTVDRDINVLCKLWFNRWQKKHEMEWHRRILHYHFENGLLRLSNIWDGEIPVAAAACLIDPENRTYNAYMTSYNPDYSKISPGIVLSAISIKEAIEQGYKYYDFSGGLDPYKLSFGPERFETKNLVIKRKRLKTKFKLFVISQVKSVLDKIR